MTDYTELKRLAEAAQAELADINQDWPTDGDYFDCQSGPEFEYLCAANPAAILALIAENDKIDADRKACWAEFKFQGRMVDELKAENEALTEKYEAARDRKNSITALKIENEQLKDDLIVFKGGISALGEASKKLTFCARTTGGTAGPDQGLMDACDAVEKSLSLVGVSRAIDYIEDLRAENAGLQTGYKAYEQVNAELRAEVARSTEREILQLAEIESLRKDAERWRFVSDKQTFIWLVQDWFPSNAVFTDVDVVIDAAMGQGEQP